MSLCALSTELTMKQLTAFVLAIFFTFTAAANVHAQAGESIWLSASTTSYKKGETVKVTVNAITATPIQGFTFQIRYDPACLQPNNAASPISSMNGLSLPQTSGLVDASFASTTPQAVNGVIAEIQFLALAGCQTDLVLESASLAIRNASGFAAPLPNVALGTKDVALNIDKAAGSQSNQPVIGTPLPLGVEPAAKSQAPNRTITLLVILLLVVIVFGVVVIFRKRFSKP